MQNIKAKTIWKTCLVQNYFLCRSNFTNREIVYTHFVQWYKLQQSAAVCTSQMQDAVSHFYDLLHFGGENVWIGARRRADDWTWVGDLPLTG